MGYVCVYVCAGELHKCEGAYSKEIKLGAVVLFG